MKLLALVPLLFVVGCSCTLERKTIEDIEASHAKILPRYLKYVDQDPDPTLKPKDKDDEHKFVESLKTLVEALKQSVKS